MTAAYADTNQITLPSGRVFTDSAPFITSYSSGNGQSNLLYCIFRDLATDRIRVVRRDSSTSVGTINGSVVRVENQSQGLDCMSKFSPAVTVFNNQIWIIYGGLNGNNIYAASSNGSTFENKSAILNAQTNDPPTASFISSVLYTIYKGQSSDQMYGSYYSEINGSWVWTGDHSIKKDHRSGTYPGRTAQAPSTYSNGSLCILAYRGDTAPTSASGIYLGYSYNDVYSWYGDTQMTCHDQVSGTDFTPLTFRPVSGALVSNKSAYKVDIRGFVAYSSFGNSGIFIAYADAPDTVGKQLNSSNWKWQGAQEDKVWSEVTINPSLYANDGLTTDVSPSAVSYGGNLYIFYKKKGTGSIYMAKLDAFNS
ncbi:MAG: hypothetical protein ACOVN0_10965 [Niveispirillum sp.]|uniref:hypothetical protein n=1 Tax=Niveispirillum sp. TaxID=1917217 RepID=UPI003BA469EC